MRAKLHLFVFAVAYGAAAFTGIHAAAYAGTAHPAVVELFTSQGCSSCPPADRLLTQLAKRDDVIALSYAVSYWDYLGWKDTLAMPGNNQRQRDYAARQGHGEVYTPQAIVNGLEHCVGSSAGNIEAAIEKTGHIVSHSAVALEAKRAGGKLVIKADAAPFGSPLRSGRVIVVAAARAVSVPIQRGENAGKTVTYTNVVRNIAVAGHWRGETAAFSMPVKDIQRKDADFIVVLLQDEKTGAILAAQRVA